MAVIFLAKWKAGEAKPLEDSIGVKWVLPNEFANYDLAPNVKRYL